MNSDPRTALEAHAIEKGESLAGLSRLIGRNPAYLQQFIKRGSPRTLSEIDRRRLSAFLRIDEAVLGGDTAAPLPASVPVPRYDIGVSAGPGSLAEGERARSEWMPHDWLRKLDVRPDQASFVRASGDSMEPTVADGDLMLVDHSARRLRAAPAVFVLRREGALSVKRLALRDGGVTIASDNPAYPPVTAAPSEIEVIGRVVWLSRALG